MPADSVHREKPGVPVPARSDLRADGMAVCAAILTLVLPSLALAGGGASLCLTETRGQGREIARYPLGQDQALRRFFADSLIASYWPDGRKRHR